MLKFKYKYSKSLSKDFNTQWGEMILQTLEPLKSKLYNEEIRPLDYDTNPRRFYELIQFEFIITPEMTTGLNRIILNPNFDEIIYDDTFKIVFDSIIFNQSLRNNENTWVKISNSTFLIYTYYDKGLVEDAFKQRNSIYKKNIFENGYAKHYQGRDRYFNRNAVMGYWNFLWSASNNIIYNKNNLDS